jgi:hypothetical protein
VDPYGGGFYRRYLVVLELALRARMLVVGLVVVRLRADPAFSRAIRGRP